MSIRARLDAARTDMWLRGCARVGEHPRLLGRPSVGIYGGTLNIGNRCTLSSRPVTSHFVAGPAAVLEIGDDVAVGHGAAIAAFERVQIGAGTRIGPFVIIMDTNFHGRGGDQSVQHDCRPVIIGRDCSIGSRVTITRGASIGDGAEILAGSVVSSAIPAGSCAGGGRARVVGQANQPGSRWESAAAMLPLLLMDTLEIATPPESDDILSEIPGWDDTRVADLLAAIDAQFGVPVQALHVNSAMRVSDLAAIVDQTRHVEAGSRAM